MNQVEVLETPIKSEADTKDYRLIKLPNGLKALLIQKKVQEGSKETGEDHVAVKLTVRIGSFDDPPNVMGLAHFLEHIVFMGSEKYPGENSFMDFCRTNNGISNAMTSSEYTEYYFVVVEKAFAEGLDRLASILTAPLLLKEVMQREREAVDSEYQMELTRTTTLVQYVFKTFMYESHPASQFDYGNLKTLKDDIKDDELHAELVKFHRKYAGNKMYLVLQSKKTLDESQELVVKAFSGIKAKCEEAPRKLTSSPDEIFKPEFFEKLIFLKPKIVEKSLMITWVLPSMYHHYKSNTLSYLSYVFRNDGEGGLQSYLKDKQLISSVSLYVDSKSVEFFILSLTVDLTELGSQNIDQVLSAIFAYFLMLKDTNIDEHRRLYMQCKKTREDDFKFERDINVFRLNQSMIHYDNVDIIRGSSLYQHFDGKVLQEIIETLNQRKFNLLIIDDDHKTFDKKEKYFGAQYQEVDFPQAYKKLWEEREPNPEFYLEKPNPFTATNHEIFVNPDESKKYPTKIYTDDVYEVWHKLDDQFKSPKASIKVHMLSTKKILVEKSCSYVAIYDYMLEQYLEKVFSQASSAGMSVQVDYGHDSYSLRFTGFNEKMEVFVEQVLKKIKHFNENMNRAGFESTKAQKMEDIINSLQTNRDLHEVVCGTILSSRYPSAIAKYNEFLKISFESFEKFIPKFFAKFKIQVLVLGNLTKSHTLKIVEIMKANIECIPLNEKHELKNRGYQIPLGTSVVRVKSMLPNNDNSRNCAFHQIGKATMRSEALCEFLQVILHTKAFDYLRSKEQLGYAVGCSAEVVNGIISFVVLVANQEKKNSYAKVQEKIDVFMTDIATKAIDELTDEEFERLKDARIKDLSVKTMSLYQEELSFWSEIKNQEYIFNREELCAKVIARLTKSDLQEFFKSFTKPETMRKLRVQVIGSVDETNENDVADVKDAELKLKFISEKVSEDENIVTDIEDFQSTLYMYPIVRFEV